MVRNGFVLVYYFNRNELKDCFGAPASYTDIRKWVRDKYGLCVSNLNVSQTKQTLGIGTKEYKGKAAAEGYYIPRLKPNKREAIIDALRYFGMV